MLRREGLYSSLLSTWRRERETGIRRARYSAEARTQIPGAIPRRRQPTNSAARMNASPNNYARPRLSLMFKKSGRAVGVADCDFRPGAQALMDAVSQLALTVGVESACDVLGVSRASFYRQRPLLGPMLTAPTVAPSVRPTPTRALSEDERKAVRAVLNSERFQDCRRLPSRPPCSMKVSIFARLGPCIGYWEKMGQRASAAIS
jgi:hypothetical protein